MSGQLGFFAALGALLVAIGIGLTFAVRHDMANTAECEAKGGVWYAPRGGGVCLKRDAILR